MRRIAVAALAVLAGAGLAGCGPGDDSGPPEARTVVLTVRHSRFVPERVEVERGTQVRFVVRNTDFIDHEFIVGPRAVHARHEKGTEARHGDVPGEVSVEAGAEATTTYVFPRTGRMVFACHLPGHLDYGMKGVVEVT